MIESYPFLPIFFPPFLIPHPKPRNQMTTDEMSSKQVRQAAPAATVLQTTGKRTWPGRKAPESRHRPPPSPTRSPLRPHSLPGSPVATHLRRAGPQQQEAEGWAARSCCRGGDGLRRSDRLGSHFWVEPSRSQNSSWGEGGAGAGLSRAWTASCHGRFPVPAANSASARRGAKD